MAVSASWAKKHFALLKLLYPGADEQQLRCFAENEQAHRIIRKFYRNLYQEWKRQTHAGKDGAEPETINYLPSSDPEPTRAATPDPTAQPLQHPTTVPMMSNVKTPVPGQKPTLVVKESVIFNLPNGHKGKEYAEVVVANDASLKNVRVVSIKDLEDIGLSFDPESQRVSGVPNTDGDFRLKLQFKRQGAEGRQSGECWLIINPNVASLWKNIEPDRELVYGEKTNTDCTTLRLPEQNLTAASCRGRSHAHVGSFRDDDYYIEHLDATGWSILVVADGAGSANYSREGSRLAVTTAGLYFAELLTDKAEADDVDRMIQNWEQKKQDFGRFFNEHYQQAAVRCVEAIEGECQKKNAPYREYSTTLLMALVKKHAGLTYLATFWMGDGAIAAYGSNGVLKLMGTPDSGEYAGQTRFLDRAALKDPKFFSRIRVGGFDDVTHVLLMTDGVSDPRFDTEAGLAKIERWDALMNDIQPCLEKEDPGQALLQWLSFPSPGHHDDRTIAVLWETENTAAGKKRETAMVQVETTGVNE